jgi:hypothetical protein
VSSFSSLKNAAGADAAKFDDFVIYDTVHAVSFEITFPSGPTASENRSYCRVPTAIVGAGDRNLCGLGRAWWPAAIELFHKPEK